MAIKFLSGLNLSNVTAGSILKLDSNGNIVAATAGTDYVASSLWTASGSNIYYSSGNVTIGASSNSAPLHVYAYQTTDPKILIEDGNTGDASMQFKISTQQYTMGIDNSDSDKFVLAASSALGTTNALEISTTGVAQFGNDIKLSNGWTLSTASTSYAKFGSWVNIQDTGFYTTASLYMDLDDSSSRFVIRSENNTEEFIGDTATDTFSIPNWSFEANDITQTASGDNWSSTTSVEYNQTGIKLSRSGSGYVSAAPRKLIGSFTASVSFKTSNCTHLGIIFAASESNQDNDNYGVILRNNSSTGTEVRVQKRVNGGQSYPISAVNVTTDCDDGNWHELTVSYNGKHIVVDVDGTNYFNQAWTDTSFTSPGLVGVAIYDDTCQFNDFQVTETPSTTTFEKLQLTSTEPQLLIKNPVSGTGNAVLKFEEGSGSTQNATITYNQGGQNNLTIATGYQSATDENLIHLAPAGNIGLTVRGGTGDNNGNVGIGTTLPTQKLEVAGTIQATSAGTATLILRGDSGNSGDTGQLDSTIKMLHDDGNHGILLETRNYAGAQSFEIKSLAASVETSRFLIDTDGTLKIPAYGAGFLTADANGDVSVDTTSYVDITGDTMTGDLTIKRGHGDLTFLTLKQENTSGDLVAQKSFIDFTFVDSNTNETPQVRIGAEVGNNDGSASNLAEEGMGAFVVYTNNADTDAGAAGTSLAERFRVDRQGRAGIGTTNPRAKLEVSGDIYQSWSDAWNFVGQVYQDGSQYRNGIATNSAARTTQIEARSAGADGEITFFIGTSEVARMVHGGNVGIGTSNPGSLLSIRATAASHQLVSINRANSDTAALYLGNNSSDDAIISGNNAPISLGKDVSGTYTEYVNIATDGELKFSAYGAGILKTNASGIVSLDTNTYLTSVSVDWSDIGSINGTININSTTQIGQGDTETLVSFQNSGTERGRFEVDDSANSYFVATGFKTTGSSTGLLKSDGTIDTSTYATTADINSFIEITDVATYLSTNNYITSSYTGFDSRYYTETEAEARFVSYENYNRAVPAAGGWYKLVKLSRGAVRIGISYTGGNMSPHTYIVEAFKDWSSTGTLNVQKYGESSYISEFRIIKESGGGNGDYYLEAYFTSLTNTHSFECYFQEILGYRSVSEIFAVSSGNTLNATNSGTNTPIEALVVGSNEGLYTRNLDVNGRLYLDTLDTNTTSTSALVLGSSSEIEKRTLGSNAFTSTTYAPLASPGLTGTPTAPTAAAGTNTTQIATTAFVSTAVSNLVDSAPATLDTLNELAAALGDDANFSTTVTNSIATKVSKSGDTMTGALEIELSTSSPLLNLYNTSNGSGAAIQFSDQTSQSQTGDITFRHNDGQSQGGGVSFHFTANQPDVVLVVGDTTNKGRFVAWSNNNVNEVDYGFADDVNTGMVQTSADNVSLVAGGVRGVGVGTTAVSLKYAGTTKLATSTSGIDVTGVLDVSSRVKAGGQISVNNRTAMSVLHWSSSGSSTGAIKITLPGSHSGNWSMIVLRITAYEYNSTAHTVYYVSGHDWTSGWYNNGVTKIGNGNKDIQLAYDSNKDYVILGGTASTWSYGHVTVDVMAHPSFYSSNMDISSGWAITQTTDLSGITTQAVTNKRVLTTSDEGSGNGIDADTVDGLQASSFLRSDATDTATGNLTFSGAVSFTSSSLHLSGHYYQKFHSGTTNYIHFYPNAHSGNASVTYMRAWTGSSFRALKIQGDSNNITWGSHTLWTSGNDGSGSGLDADTLDGNHASAFVAVAGDTMTGNLSFTDTNNSIGQSFFKSGGSLNLIIDSNNNQSNASFIIEKDTQTAGSGTELFRVQEDGSVGIGTTSPGGKLHLEGDFESGKALVIKGTYGTDTEYYFRTHGTNSEYLALYAGGVRVMNWNSGVIDTYKGLNILGGDITTDSNNALTLGSSVQVGQGDEDPIVEFKHGSTQLGKFDQDGYLYATGFKTSGTTGFLRSDGSVDTTTYANGADYLALAGGTMTGDLTIPSKIIHSGDTNTFFQFNTDEILLATGGGSGFKVNNTSVFAYKDLTIAGGETLSLGERAEADDNGRTVLIEGAANASTGEGSGRIFFSEHNSTSAAADSYGLSLYYEGDPNVALPSGFQPNTGNATWSLRRHDNSVNGTPIFFGSRSNSNVTFEGTLSVPEYIYHRGDANTYIRLLTDRIQIVAGGTTKFDSNNTYLLQSTNISVRNITARDIVSESDRTYSLGTDANRWAVVFCETLDSAGQHESKLQNPEGETPIGEYETGTVLVWKGGKNVPCTTAADHMRMGIAVKGIESPLVQGAEPVLCTGEVKEGDYLVTSTTEGHAEAISPEFMRQHMLFDCVIGKALEDGAGESHLVKTWINI